ncbi:MAG: topoisomerase IV, partial [Oscillospiraceae bacterium]
NSGRVTLLDTGRIASRTVRGTAGVAVMTLRAKASLVDVKVFAEGMLGSPHRYVAKTLPTTGSIPRTEDVMDQMTL